MGPKAGSSRIWLEADGEEDGETVGAGAACNLTASTKREDRRAAEAERILTTAMCAAAADDDGWQKVGEG